MVGDRLALKKEMICNELTLEAGIMVDGFMSEAGMLGD